MKQYMSYLKHVLRDVFTRKLSNQDASQIEQDNLHLAVIFSLPLSIVEFGIFLIGAILFRDELFSHLPSLLSVFSCGLLCLASHLLTRRWAGKDIDRKKIRLLTGSLYWAFVIWGMTADVRHYMGGSQMIIFDTVQVCFAMILYLHPMHALLRVFFAYTVQFLVLFHIDKAKGMPAVNYYMFAVVVLIGYCVHYVRKLHELQHEQHMENMNQDLIYDSTHDHLTGMKNRLALRQDFSSFVGKRLYVIMADIDDFKQYNDNYGHAAGDQVLSAISRVTLELFGYDSVYRYGGDEFLMILEQERYENILDLLVVWENETERVRIGSLGEETVIQCSYGMSRGAADSEKDIRSLIKRADEKKKKKKKTRQR